MVGDPAADKAHVRRSVRLARAARGEARQHESDLQLAGVLAGLLSGLPAGSLADPLTGPGHGATGSARPVVGAYVSLPGEPPTRSMRRAAAAHGCEVLLPWLRPDLDLDWVRDDPAHVTSTRVEALRPPGPLLGTAAVLRCRLLLVPAIAVDTVGNRLGQGGGSYDRVLRRVRAAAPPGPLVLAVVHPEELLDASHQPLPHEPHDMAVDGVLTTSGVQLRGAARSAGPAQ